MRDVIELFWSIWLWRMSSKYYIININYSIKTQCNSFISLFSGKELDTRVFCHPNKTDPRLHRIRTNIFVEWVILIHIRELWIIQMFCSSVAYCRIKAIYIDILVFRYWSFDKYGIPIIRSDIVEHIFNILAILYYSHKKFQIKNR